MRPKTSIVTLILLLAITIPALHAKNSEIILTGKVKDAITKADLTEAKIVRYDKDGNPTDSIGCRGKRVNLSGDILDTSAFSFTTERKDTTITYDVVCPGYITRTVVYRLDKIGKRESSRQMPIVFLERAPHQLGEVTVTMSKVKFYHKGDTIVYNADAFQLAEGSMLDALISQLPGVELNDNGQIKVNGQFVESLLLNGKDFFDGNNQLMLDNIAAYTVKSVNVYDGQTKMEKWAGDSIAPKHFTMDVRLKKEYNMGWLINAQGGAGTESRYLGRLFASWFNRTTRISFIGNLNNLNDSRKPGKNDTWTPESMPSGTRRQQYAGLNYNYESTDEKISFSGNTFFEKYSTNNLSTTARTNFLDGGDTYENSFSKGRNGNLRIESKNELDLSLDSHYLHLFGVGRYIRRDNSASNVSASFDKEQTDITMKAIEALYSDGSPERLDAVINRSISRSDGNSREYEVKFYPTFNYRIPRTSDILKFQIGVEYKNKKEELWRDYNINYGSNPIPAEKLRQYFDNSPNRDIALDATAGYYRTIGKVRTGIQYSYRFMVRERDSYMYALDRLTDMGIYGQLPAGYLSSFDPGNSFTSRTIENHHSICPDIRWYEQTDNHWLMLMIRPDLSVQHHHFNYFREDRLQPVRRTSFIAIAKKYSARIESAFSPYSADSDGNKGKRSRRGEFRHSISYDYNIDTETPDLYHMVDIENDSDPLNIALGNPNLKNAYVQTHTLSWIFTPQTVRMDNNLSLSYEHTTDALVRGYTYDTSTGVRRNRTYNTDGNNTLNATNDLMLQFGRRQEFTLSSSTEGHIIRNSDMIGVNMQEPVKSEVRTVTLGHGLRLSWQIGKQSITLRGKVTNRHTTSTREDFNTIDALHCNYGIAGNFKLPYGFGISTDFMFYTRDGYGSKQLDTTDAIWNMRLTYAPRKSHWVFMVDGFDMLHQLSNVNYAVNAQGRTVTYTNTLPRYVMFSLQYRLNIQPRKRK